MKVIYTGPRSLRYHSAPSRNDYVFFSGVPLDVLPEDEECFRSKAAIPGSPWRIEGIEEVVAKTVTGAIVDAVDATANRLTGNQKGKTRKGGGK